MKKSNCSRTGMALKSVLAALLSVGGLVVSAQEWQPCTPLPESRFEYASVAVKDVIYVIGCHTGNSISDAVFYAKANKDGTLSSWQDGNPLPVKLAYVTAVANKDKIYVLGGSNDAMSEKVFYTTVNNDGIDEWKETTPLPKKINVGSVVVYKDTIYYIGGWYWRGGWSAKIKEDGTLGEWKEIQNMISPRGAAMVFADNDCIYLCGGNAGHTADTRKADVFRTKVLADGSLEKWEKMTKLPFANDAMAGVLVGKKIILLGGAVGEAKALSATINEKSELGDWTEEKYSLPKPLWSFRALYVNGWVYIIAGFSKSDDGKPAVSNAVYRLKAQ